jgi:ribosomal protein S18 acetylase RimI-like enzyme
MKKALQRSAFVLRLSSFVPMITITSANDDNVDLLEALLHAAGGRAAVDGLRAARERYDLLRSDSFWLLMARVDGQPAGLAAVARLPKADARVGFLFVDELWVLPAYQRQGVATALLRHVIALASDLGLAGVRLLVRPENEAARRLYRALGFDESATVFCERKGE